MQVRFPHSWCSGSVTTLFLFLSIISCSCQSTSPVNQHPTLSKVASYSLYSKNCINGTTKWIYYETCHPTCRWCYSIHRLDPSVGSSVSLSLTEFIGELEHKFPQSFIVKYSDKADSSSPLQDTEDKIKLKKNEGEQHLKLINEWWVELPVHR